MLCKGVAEWRTEGCPGWLKLDYLYILSGAIGFLVIASKGNVTTSTHTSKSIIFSILFFFFSISNIAGSQNFWSFWYCWIFPKFHRLVFDFGMIGNGFKHYFLEQSPNFMFSALKIWAISIIISKYGSSSGFPQLQGHRNHVYYDYVLWLYFGKLSEWKHSRL